MVLTLQASKRLFTKLTLIPAELLFRPFLLVSKKRLIWQVSEDQKRRLRIQWKQIFSRSKGISISFYKDKELIQKIKSETQLQNKNNLTRTAAYLAFFNKHPEIEWSFLAHMVSRNAGYFMTDLKGEFLPDILEDTFSEALYLMLEKGNSMIFEDAFPQLLLYEESKKRGVSLFHLCRFFHVSAFMEGVWELFFQGDHTPLLPVAQIINEQNHIEKNLVQTIEYKRLLSKITYRIQEWLELSQIIFPILPLKYTVGKKMKKFENLEQRIQLGKHLYALLFKSTNFHSVYHFAQMHPHTGSRTDYDKNVFTIIKPMNNEHLKEKLSFFKTKSNQKVYSPYLDQLWEQNYNGPFFSSDWFNENDMTLQKMNLTGKPAAPIWLSYWAGLHKIESAYLIKKYYRLYKKNRNL